MSEAFEIRPASVADAPIIARHRAEMFTDMGELPARLYDELVRESIAYLEQAIPAGEYLGWLAFPEGRPREIVAGAGAQRRRILPRATRGAAPQKVAHGRQAIVLNVFTEKTWRRRGLAELLMRRIMRWFEEEGLDDLVLHASGEGRRIYERLGFQATNEMRLKRS